MWVLYDPSSSGYFFDACYRTPSVPEFLTGYENKMAEGDVLHVGTHPPGLFLFHKLLLAVCQASETVTNFSLWSSPHEYQATFQVVERAARIHPIPLTDPQRAALWMAVQITQACALLTLFPIYLLLRITCSRQASLLMASLWPLTPALAVFLPKSDAIYPLIGATFLVLWLAARRRSSRLLATTAGLIALSGLSLSLALMPLFVVAGLITVLQVCHDCLNPTSPQTRRETVWNLLHDVGWAGIGFGIPLLALNAFANLNLIQIWCWNYQNHAAFYDVYGRTYWKWLWINPWETALAIGLPVTWLAICSGVRSFKRPRSVECLVWCGVWGGLWLSGKTMGEAARLWLVMFPGGLWLAAPALPQNPYHIQRFGLLVLAIQAACTLTTVTGMSGFHFPGL
jgi:hypothetical protein